MNFFLLPPIDKTTGITTHERSRQGETNDWLTPMHVIHALGPFDLDVAASEAEPYRCADRAFTWQNDGLSQMWEGFVWCNPPYGPHTGKWLTRMHEHNNGIALVFARTDTRAIQPALRHATCAFFLSRRLQFVRPNGKPGVHAGAPSLLLGYGATALNRLTNCGLEGVRMFSV